MSCLQLEWPPVWLHHDSMIYIKHITLGKRRYTKPDTHLVLVHIKVIYCTARNGHSKVSFQGNTVDIISAEVKLHILHILVSHHIREKDKHTFLPYPSLPPFSLALSYWPSFLWAVCEKRGKRKKGTAHFHFLWLKHLYHTGTNYRTKSEKQTWTVSAARGDALHCTSDCLWME